MSQSPRRPLSAEAQAVVNAMQATGGVSRRSMLAGGGALGLSAVLAACSTSSPGAATGAGASPSAIPAAEDKSATEKIVRWANWTEYLDIDDAGHHKSLIDFTKATGIEATYAEDVDDNESYYAKNQAQLKRGKDMGKDVIVLTDWMASRMIKQGLVQKLNKANIPNFANMRPALQEVPWDKGREYTMTWQSGYTGIGYNVKECKRLGITINEVSDLWQPKLKNRVMVLSEMRDTMGLLMSQKGVDVRSFTEADFNTALNELETQLNSGQIRTVVGNSYVEKMASGDALATICWSGDIFQMNTQYQKAHNLKDLPTDLFDFKIPTSGGLIWSDNMMIPIGSPHKTNAEKLMNWYYDPKVAAEVADYVNYLCPVPKAEAELKKLDPAILPSEYIFPDAKYLGNLKAVRDLTDAEQTKFTKGFQQVLGL